MEDTLVSLFGPILAKLWVAAVTMAAAAYSLERCFRGWSKPAPKKRKKFHPYLRAKLVKDPTWPPKVNLN